MRHRFKRVLAGCCAHALFAAVLIGQAAAADDRFDIMRFQVEGNTLLQAAEIDRTMAPLAGRNRAYSDIQLAVQALERAYRQAGYGAVLVSVPEQELTGGTVTIRVVESRLGAVSVSGNIFFDEANIRASLVRLQPGSPPDLQAISTSIQLANENPAKQVSVTLAETRVPGVVDANVAVVDNNPLRFITTLDNTGSSSSGRWRTGIAVQHANLFNRDHVATLAYTVSPDAPSDVDLGLFSLGYRVPLYAFGDSVDFIYGRSRVNTPGTSPVLGGLLGFTGRGEVYGLRWNHFLGRDGESTSRLVVGLDHKQIDSRCAVGGVPVSIAPPTPPIASCVPYETTPLSLTYSRQRESVGEISAFSAGISRNLPTGTRFTNIDGRVDRYSYLSPGNRTTPDGFMALTGSASLFKAFSGDWQGRVAGTAQYTNKPLVASEQFGLAGSMLVRGFQERAVSADSGLVINTEVYSPELAASTGLPGQLRVLAFFDAGYGANNHVGTSSLPGSISISSAGVGARYSYGRDFGLRLDAGRVIRPGDSITEKRGDWNAHLSATLAF